VPARQADLKAEHPEGSVSVLPFTKPNVGFVKAMLRLLKENLVLILVIAAIGAAYLLLRTHPSDVSSQEELEALMAGDRPVLVELYANA